MGLRMRLGENFADLLVTSAREKILYGNYNPGEKSLFNSALDIIKSAIGCDNDIALLIVTGDFILTVDEDRINLNGEYYNKLTDGKKYDILQDMQHIVDNITDDCFHFNMAAKNIVSHNATNKQTFICVDIETTGLSNMFADNKSLSSLFDMEKIIDDNGLAMYKVLPAINNFITESYKRIAAFKAFIEYVNTNTELNYYVNFSECDYKLQKLYVNFDKIVSGNCADDINDHIANAMLLKHIDAAIENEKVLSKKIEPADISLQWDAAWISPTGEMYALNGCESNMLHINIAEALRRDDIIPEEASNNPDRWLEENGWCKLSKNRILYAGYLSDTPIMFTQEMKQTIYKNLSPVYKDIILGFIQTHEIPMRKFRSTELLMLRQYFV